MNQTALLRIAEAAKVSVIDYDFSGGMLGLYADQVILLNNSMDEDSRKCILAEELGHHFTVDGNRVEMQQVTDCIEELKGRQWGYESLLPISQIKAVLHVGIDNLEELTKLFGVTKEFLLEAITFYFFSGQLNEKTLVSAGTLSKSTTKHSSSV